MNSIEDDSTSFISIEKNNVKNKINSFKNIKSKYNPKSKNKFQTQISEKKPNSQLNLNPSFSTKIILPNNISKIKSIENYKINDNKNKSFMITIKKQAQHQNKKQPKNENIEGNIEIDDTDEFSDIKFNINVNKPKLPFHDKNYYNNSFDDNETEKNTPSVSKNILDNLLKKNPNDKSQEIKRNNCHKIYRNKSCCFENNNLIKFRLNQNISILKSKIDMLKTLIKARNKQILSFQVFFEKNNFHKKIKKNYLFSDKRAAEMKKNIFNLKMIKLKCEEIYINKKISEKEINNENNLHKAKKAELIDKILNYKLLLLNEKTNANTNITKKNEINIHNSSSNYFEENTIINDSNFFGDEENFNFIDTRNSNYKKNNIINQNEDEDFFQLNNKINCIKNKKVKDYFVPRFLIEIKTSTHLNNNQINVHPNSKFNILVNSNKAK